MRRILAEYVAACPTLHAGLTRGVFAPSVCVEHGVGLPCTTCMFETVAAAPYSDDPEDVARATGADRTA